MNKKEEIDIQNFNKYQIKKLSYLIGSLLGDGCLYIKKYVYQFSITSEDYDYCKRCFNIIHNIFNKKGNIKTIYRNNKISYYQLVVCSKDIVLFLKNITNSKNIIPLFVFDNKKNMKYFVQGLMDADGWISKINASDGYLRYRIGFKNTSKWIFDFRKIFETLEVKIGKKLIVKDKTSKNIIYSFSINTEDYCNKIGFKIIRKRKIQIEYLKWAISKKKKKTL